MSSVLLVEDNEDVRSVMTRVLRFSGSEVETAADGREALERLRTRPKPGVILLDLMMPRMDGRQFRQEQRRDPALADIPVVLTSAAHDLHEQAEALGAVAYLQKPVVFEELLELVRRYDHEAGSTA